MKTICIYVYDIDVVNRFLDILHPMATKMFNLEVYLYTSYASENSIGGIGITKEDIQGIIENKRNYSKINNIKVHGLVAAGPNLSPEPKYFEKFGKSLVDQIEKLELNGINLDYEFSDDWDTKKKHYTDFTLYVSGLIKNHSISADVGSYKNSGIDLYSIYKKPISIINMGTYAILDKKFNQELYYMMTGPINSTYQIPGISFDNDTINMGSRMKTLEYLGYNKIAIFNPLGSSNKYPRDIANYINASEYSPYFLPHLFGIGGGIITCVLSGLIFYFFNIAVLTQLWILGITSVISLGSMVFIYCNIRSTINYTLLVFTLTLFMTCTLWLGVLYIITYCNISGTTIKCKAPIIEISDIEMSNHTLTAIGNTQPQQYI